MKKLPIRICKGREGFIVQIGKRCYLKLWEDEVYFTQYKTEATVFDTKDDATSAARYYGVEP